jgi:hypothetical protein
MLISWERADDDLKKLMDVLEPAERGKCASIGTLIKRKRALGYDSALEALLARRWHCPHCKQSTTVEEVGIPVGGDARMAKCLMCGEEGIAPVQAAARLEVREGGKTGLRPT